MKELCVMQALQGNDLKLFRMP